MHLIRRGVARRAGVDHNNLAAGTGQNPGAADKPAAPPPMTTTSYWLIPCTQSGLPSVVCATVAHEVMGASCMRPVKIGDGWKPFTNSHTLRANSQMASGAVHATGSAELQERWTRDVLHCPYCHGYEIGGQRLGVLGGTPGAVRYAHQGEGR